MGINTKDQNIFAALGFVIDRQPPLSAVSGFYRGVEGGNYLIGIVDDPLQAVRCRAVYGQFLGVLPIIELPGYASIRFR
ncbi:hypothetical protein FBZ98_101981 [Rhizobium sp. ERR 922]|uniref:hypothetical protein n=1 Tax=Rhizobium sp. ERR 942 TaxID=2572676 RepID=UPI0011AC5E91|nr:hypothetical protein [Rhizobium sp. ERR 942]TWB61636.1 hypothetical protein FBZ98_101981 [Rhizobium sp. ERR 922]TWC04562.1 hypothetical protein FBZ97_101981 [Rhizobium sp. ERR 942]